MSPADRHALALPNAIATVSISGTLEDKLRSISAAGFDGVEIFENDLIASPLSPREVRALLDDLGLTCVLYQPFRDFEGLPEPWRSRAFDRAEAKFDLMGELGTDRILVCSNCSPHALDDRARIVDDFRELGDRAARRGITIGYEALAWGRHVADHRVAWEIVAAVDRANVGIVLDSFHSMSRAIPNDSIRDIPGDRIAFVQLADAPRMAMDLLQWSRHYRNLPGQGEFDMGGYVAEILRTGYVGPLSLEIFNDRFRASSADTVARDGLRSLRYVREQAARALSRATSMPAPQAPGGIAFVEFTATGEEAARLGSMFASLGFALVGQHRVKKVTRWRSGTVDFVINSEDRGFASAYRTMHGAAICAIGLRVSDVDAVLARAAKLGIDRYDSGPRARPAMPALRGVGGSLIYLVGDDGVERLWAREFERIEDCEPAVLPTDATGVDHLAGVVLPDEFLSWKLYWRSMFGLEEPAAQDVFDPSGLIRSQPIESPDRAFRLTLNTSDARQTLPSRFVVNGFGAGFQHVALSCDDIFATAAAIVRDGAELLIIPTNYYADLAARFGLDDSVLERMACFGILYDEDAEGRRYWQLYTRAFDKRFFFEFVQREAGYDGYGAANASVRLATQSLFRDDNTGAME